MVIRQPDIGKYIIDIAINKGEEEIKKNTNENNIINRETSASLVKQAKDAISLKKYEEAKEFLRLAIKTYKSNAQAHFYLGVLREEEEDLEGAKKEYKQAILLDKGYSEAHFYLGNLLLNSFGDIQNAEKHFRKVKDSRFLTETKLYLGFIEYYIKGGGAKSQGAEKIAESIKEDEKVKELLPNDSALFNSINKYLKDQPKI